MSPTQPFTSAPREDSGKRIGLIIGSTRTPRVGPSIASLLQKHIDNYLSILSSSPTTTAPPTLHIIDISAQNLPLYNEPTIPMYATSSESYTQAHSQNWSRLISTFDAFIFLTPQYNWSIPSSLKNGIDYLFNEWKGKPAMIISYGMRGGDKAARHLLEILHGVRMNVDWFVDKDLGVVEDIERERVVDGRIVSKGTGVVLLKFGKVEGAINAAGGEGKLVDGFEEVWSEEFGRVVEGVKWIVGQMGGV